MASRPLVQVYGYDNKVTAVVPTPHVFLAPIRHDIVSRTVTALRKNRRQPYAVSKYAGTQTSAESWGTGRAVARIPRVPGGGTHRAGQGAFGNMCRGGRMFAPTRVWRKWHQQTNLNQRRYAVASALAATAIPALVMARGHEISKVNEVPCVVDDKTIDTLRRTKKAEQLLVRVGALEDVRRVQKGDRKRHGRAKWRNRGKKRLVGPLIVVLPKFSNQNQRAFRNLAGCEVVSVFDLNVLRLAPGGHLGRFIIWSKAAFEQLDNIYGTDRRASSMKKGYWLPRPMLTNPDLARVFNSDAVAQVARAHKTRVQPLGKKPNYVKNRVAYQKLNPFIVVQKEIERRRHILSKTHKLRKLALAKRKYTALKKGATTPEGKAKLKAFREQRLVSAREGVRARKSAKVNSNWNRLLQGLPALTKQERKELRTKAQAAIEKRKTTRATGQNKTIRRKTWSKVTPKRAAALSAKGKSKTKKPKVAAKK